MMLSYQNAEIGCCIGKNATGSQTIETQATNSRGSEDPALVNQRFRKRGRRTTHSSIKDPGYGNNDIKHYARSRDQRFSKRGQ